MLNTPGSFSKGRLTPVEVAGYLQTIPSAPATLDGLEEIFYEGPSSLGELTRLVRYEPGLAAQILRTRQACPKVFTPSFAIEDAINDLGFTYVQDIALEATRSQVIDQPLDVYNMSMNDFWRRSVSTAIAAELLAEATGEDAGLSFTIGLLHNIGMLAIDVWARNESPELVFAHRTWPREFSMAESSLLGFTNAEVGSALLAGWDLPQRLSEVVRLQYVPLRFGPYARSTCLLLAAKWLSAAVCLENGMPKMPEAVFLDVLRIPSFELAQMVVEVRVRLGGVRNALHLTAA